MSPRHVALLALAAHLLARGASAQASGGAPPPVSYDAPADAPYRAEQLTIRSPYGHSLGATLTIPKGSGARFPAVVLISGTGAQDRDGGAPGESYRPFRQIADALSRRGVAVLRMDDRGVTEGNYFSFTGAHDVAEDVRAALALLRTRRDIDPSRIGLLGHSEGGLVATMVALGDPSLRAVALLGAPGVRPIEAVRAQLRLLADRDSALTTAAARDSAYRAQLARIAPQLGASWFRPTAEYDPAAAARLIRAPAVLVLQGGNDWQVMPDQARLLAEAFRSAGNPDVTLRIVDGVNHLLLPDRDGNPNHYSSLPSQAIPAPVLAEFTGWLAARLRAGR